MDLLAIIRIAMRALARNKLRSALTMLGIIIGVGAVIAMVSVGQGAQAQAQQQIAAMGSNMLFVQSGTVNRGGMRMGWGATKTLVYDDLTAILRECPSGTAPAPPAQPLLLKGIPAGSPSCRRKPASWSRPNPCASRRDSPCRTAQTACSIP